MSAAAARHLPDGNGVLRHMRAWQPSLAQHPAKTRRMSISAAEIASLPSSAFDTDFSAVPTYDQLALGSCTDNAALYNYRHAVVKRLLASGMTIAQLLADPSLIFEPSRLYLYDKAREKQGTPLTDDSGSTTDVTNDALTESGVCDEKFCPYSDDPAIYSQPPSAAAEADAANHRETLAYAPDSIEAQKFSIVTGWGVQFGFSCFKGLMTAQAAQTGEIPFPEPDEDPIGGHEMYKVGFDDNYLIGAYRGVWIVAQSWGRWGATRDGIQRYALLPYQYDVAGLASNNKTIRLVSP